MKKQLLKDTFTEFEVIMQNKLKKKMNLIKTIRNGNLF